MPQSFDDGTINHQMNVTALPSGGFAVGYEDNSHGAQSDITVAIFDSTGLITDVVRASGLSSNDSQAAVTTLSNGLVMSTFTNDAGTDTDIRGTLIDPTTGNGNALTDALDPLVIAAGFGDDSESSVSATGLAQFVVSYSDSQFAEVSQKTFQLVRTATGDAGDDTFTGDDAVDIVNGLGGAGNFRGGANYDTLNGGDGNDFLDGGAGKDNLNGGANNDYLVGGDGDDTLNGGTGADAMLGGLGNDTYIIDNTSDEVHEASALATEIDIVRNSVAYTLGAHLENLVLTLAANVNGTGNTLANVLTGNAGIHVLKGLGGNDTLFGRRRRSGRRERRRGRRHGHRQILRVVQLRQHASGQGCVGEPEPDRDGSKRHRQYPCQHHHRRHRSQFYAFLFNGAADTGYLLADLDKNGAFETGVILAGAGAAADFGFADIV